MSNETTELKPCFCGRIPKIETHDVEPQEDRFFSGKTITFVLCECGQCLFDGAFLEGFADEEDAATAWNYGAGDPREPEAWLVYGPFGKAAFAYKDSAESYCRGSNQGYGSDVYKIKPLSSRTPEGVEGLEKALEKAIGIADSWIHDQLDGATGLKSALEELEPCRAALAKYRGEA